MKALLAYFDATPVKRLLFGLFAILLGVGLALAGAEICLRLRNRAILRASLLEPGLFLRDSALGWRLTPFWKGSHRERDYFVRYTINGDGFRGEPAGRIREGAPRRLVLGDSFTFGLGVNDEETFVHRLNETAAGARYLNLGVPGYSTDQEVLLLDQELRRLPAQSVLLVVYLGNDLIDNERPFPMQAPDAKPYFVLTAAGLELRNSPVPPGRKSTTDPEFDLVDALLRSPARSGLLRRLSRYTATRPMVEWVTGRGDVIGRLGLVCGPSLDLFDALARRAQGECGARGAEFTLALLPGRSLIEKPASLSAKYQEFLRGEILRRGRAAGLTVIDLAEPLRGRPGLFHPHDGHLTPEGHRAVAAHLAGRL